MWRSVELTRYQSRYEPLTDNLVFIGTPGELSAAQASGKFETITPEQTLAYPDGSPGFYIFQPKYSAEGLKALFVAEEEERRKPVTEETQLGGADRLHHALALRHGRGAAPDRQRSLHVDQGMEANPLLLQVDFPTPRAITAVRLTTGTMDLFTLTIRAYTDVDAPPVTLSQQFVNAGKDPELRLELPGVEGPIVRLAIEIHDELSGERANIHVRELALEP